MLASVQASNEFIDNLVHITIIMFIYSTNDNQVTYTSCLILKELRGQYPQKLINWNILSFFLGKGLVLKTQLCYTEVVKRMDNIQTTKPLTANLREMGLCRAPR